MNKSVINLTNNNGISNKKKIFVRTYGNMEGTDIWETDIWRRGGRGQILEDMVGSQYGHMEIWRGRNMDHMSIFGQFPRRGPLG